MVRVRSWNLIDRVRNFSCHSPGARGAICYIPNAVIARVIEIAVAKHCIAGVLGILNIDVLNRRKLRSAIVCNAEGRVFAIDGGGLGYGVIQNGFTRLRRTRNLRQHVSVDRVFRDVAERVWQLVIRYMFPLQVAKYARASIPAPR